MNSMVDWLSLSCLLYYLVQPGFTDAIRTRPLISFLCMWKRE